jgi:isocitrate/isopropylmalate dehydrogenase
MTRSIRLAVIGGDGIGPEVTAEAVKVLDDLRRQVRPDRVRPRRGPVEGDR